MVFGYICRYLHAGSILLSHLLWGCEPLSNTYLTQGVVARCNSYRSILQTLSHFADQLCYPQKLDSIS